MKAVSVVIALGGLWEFGDIAAVFVPDFGPIPAFLWNHILVGLVLMATGAGAALAPKARVARRLHWLAAAAGGWLIATSVWLGLPNLGVGVWNDVLVGLIVLALGGWAARHPAHTVG